MTRTEGSPIVPIAIRRLFVANRGEIARRIERTARRLGIEAVLPATDADGALDLLDVGAVVGAAREAGADALHPGFGFLAESPDLAAAVHSAGIAWVGPPASAIAAMGDKAAARRLAAGLGVPVLPGYDEPDQSDEALATAVRRIGLPVVVKPAAGGGGKGMRVVRAAGELPAALAAARREAAAAFGDDRLILERLAEGARHVEVQVLFDAHGKGVHLGERDCSIQRRHQKILEETPSPAVPAPVRTAIADAALTLARAIGYVSAGTVEFLVDGGGFHFLEMNTRLQVEHPVTELVTGLDLVEQQLRVASGERLGVDQAALDARRHGHAVEVRLYAEDAERGFLPATGRVVTLAWPDGPGVRVDSGIDPGDVVSARFDPMLAKVIAHGATRGEALERLAQALDRTVVLGIVTNLRFLRWLVRQPVVRAGDARIDTLERIWPPDGWAQTQPDEATWAAAARALHTAGGGVWAGGWRLNAPSRLRLVSDEGDEVCVVVVGEAPADGRGNVDYPAVVVAAGVAYADVDGRSVAFSLAPPPDEGAAASSAAGHRGGAGDRLNAPMPGMVIGLHVHLGSAVAAGAPVATLEAMKMEHVVVAPHAGTVTALEARVGDQVARGQLLAVVEPSPYSPAPGGTPAS